MYYNDLHSFNLSSVEWVALDPGSDGADASETQSRPSPRTYLGLAATSTHLYLFGGWGGTGEPVFRTRSFSPYKIKNLYIYLHQYEHAHVL